MINLYKTDMIEMRGNNLESFIIQTSQCNKFLGGYFQPVIEMKPTPAILSILFQVRLLTIRVQYVGCNLESVNTECKVQSVHTEKNLRVHVKGTCAECMCKVHVCRMHV